MITLFRYFADTEFLIECLGFALSCTIITYAAVRYGLAGIQQIIDDVLLNYNTTGSAIAEEKNRHSQNTKLLEVATNEYDTWKSGHLSTLYTLDKTLTQLTATHTSSLDVRALQVATVCDLVTQMAHRLQQAPTTRDLKAISECL